MADIEVFRARNTTGLAINGTRVTNTKPYGLMRTTLLFKCKDEDIIEALGADVQLVKRGKWENTNSPNQLRCSRCDVIHFIAQYPHGDINYCPNCGADMRGEY